VHEKAIYLQNGRQHQVERLDYEGRKAFVRTCDSDYFTNAISYTKIKILETFDAGASGHARKNHGEVQVNTRVVGFKKIKFQTMENVGSGELTLPEQEMPTTAFWITLPQAIIEELPYPRSERLDGVAGLANALQAVATLLVMCEARDLGVSVGENAAREGAAAGDPRATVLAEIFEPNIYLYDKYPGGIGFSEPLFRLSETLLEKTHRLIAGCPCQEGCPSCVGPVGEMGEKGKEVALAILNRIRSSA
jgi:DEAD/DEAH box helicase domain-containing protein